MTPRARFATRFDQVKNTVVHNPSHEHTHLDSSGHSLGRRSGGRSHPAARRSLSQRAAATPVAGLDDTGSMGADVRARIAGIRFAVDIEAAVGDATPLTRVSSCPRARSVTGSMTTAAVRSLCREGFRH